MSESKAPSRFYLWVIVSSLAAAALARTVSVFYSILSTDIVYMYSWQPSLLNYLRQLLNIAPLAILTAAAVVVMVKAKPLKKPFSAVVIIAAITFAADLASAFVIDFINSTILGKEIIAVINLSMAFVGKAIIFTAVCIAAHIIIGRSAKIHQADTMPVLDSASPKAGAGQALLCSACIAGGVEFVQLTVDVVLFLIDVEFAPYMSELADIAGDYVTVIFINFGAFWAIAAGFYAIFSWLFERRESIAALDYNDQHINNKT